MGPPRSAEMNTHAFDLAIRCARLRGSAYRYADIGIKDGRIAAEKYAEEWIVENARRAVVLAALHANLHIRAFADVDAKARLEGVKALLRVRDEFRGIVDLQVVAFAQDGIVREPGAAELMRAAMALGADVVGGISVDRIDQRRCGSSHSHLLRSGAGIQQGRLDAA